MRVSFIIAAIVVVTASSTEDSWQQFVPGGVLRILDYGAPSGTYAGEKSILGEDIKATVTIDDSTHMDLQISGAISVNCKQEGYQLSGNNVNVPGASKAGDCIHDALAGKATLEGITYDPSSDEISVKVKKIITITFVLKKSTRLEGMLIHEKKVNAATLNLTWKDCGDSSTHAKVTDVEPKSLQTGSKTTITGAGTLDEEVDDDATFTMKMTGALGITLLNCNGDAAKGQTCKLPLGVGSMSLEPIKFPIAKGKITGIPKVDLTLSASLPSSMAKTTTTITAAAKNGDKMFCVKVMTAPGATFGAAEAACSSSSDQALWKTEQKTFEADMAKCGKQCMGGADCVKTCIQGIAKYSDGCATCFGALAGCTKSKCLFKCIKGNSPSCTQCVKANCDAPFTTCSGLTPPPSASLASLVVPLKEVRPEVQRLVYGWDMSGKDVVKCGGTGAKITLTNKLRPSMKFRTCTKDVDPKTGWACNHGTPFVDCDRRVNMNESVELDIAAGVETILPITYTASGAVDMVSSCYWKKPAAGWGLDSNPIDQSWWDALQKSC